MRANVAYAPVLTIVFHTNFRLFKFLMFSVTAWNVEDGANSVFFEQFFDHQLRGTCGLESHAPCTLLLLASNRTQMPFLL